MSASWYLFLLALMVLKEADTIAWTFWIISLFLVFK